MIQRAGDAAVTLALGHSLDAGTNTRALAIAEVLDRAGLPGVRDVVPTLAALTVHFDPAVTPADEVAFQVQCAGEHPRTTVQPSRLVEVPVAYGGADGPDLEALATHAGLTAGDVVRRHTSEAYRVFMLGFTPGFPYLGPVDPSLVMPRHRTPRLQIAAGSVGIADQLTGIYPRSGPGGWQIIGRTSFSLFDPTRPEPSRLRPGDQVRFVPVAAADPVFAPEPPLPPVSGPSITVVRPGWHTTVQDLGRWGWQRLGVPVSGAMDLLSHRAANRLVGNPDAAATLEITIVGPEVRFEQTTLLAMCGAEVEAVLDGRPLRSATVAQASPGSVLRCGVGHRGTRAYLACAGGIAAPRVLGSRATHVGSRLGGWAGRALQAGDRVPLGPWSGNPDGPLHDVPDTTIQRGGVTTLRVLMGPHADLCDPAVLERLTEGPFQVSPHANRMGFRLDGGPTTAGRSLPMLSGATVQGAIQITGSGTPILLAADRQTTGGYPQAAVVIAADLPRMGQLGPGDWMHVRSCTPAEAHTALMNQEAAFGRG